MDVEIQLNYHYIEESMIDPDKILTFLVQTFI